MIPSFVSAVVIDEAVTNKIMLRKKLVANKKGQVSDKDMIDVSWESGPAIQEFHLLVSHLF
jgi:hypothetical protein